MHSLSIARAVVAAVTLATGGCILLLGDGPAGTTRCRFEGDDTAECGKCIAARCQAEVDGCCAEATCAVSLGELDRCSDESSSDACVSLRDAKNEKLGKLGACVEQCAYACGPRCTGDEACDDGEGCHHGRCRKRCIDSDECGAGGVCSAEFCSDPLGTPCGDILDCNGPNCLTTDSDGREVPGYCSRSCGGAHECPFGYTCWTYGCSILATAGKILDTCNALCAKLEDLGCPIPNDCPAICAHDFVGAGTTCTDRLLKVLACIAKDATSCVDQTPPSCLDQAKALAPCGCVFKCPGGDDALCVCEERCNDAVVYETSCTDDNGTITCSCRVDGSLVGECADSWGNACSPEFGCCRQLFGW